VTRVTEPAPRTGAARTDRGAVGSPRVDTARGGGAESRPKDTADTASALSELVGTLDRACEELFAAVPFPGDQATGACVNAYVDDVVAALRGLRAEADDLRRVVAVADQSSRGGVT
jgi:hypothetical protein